MATDAVSVRVRAKGDEGSLPLTDFIARAKTSCRFARDGLVVQLVQLVQRAAASSRRHPERSEGPLYLRRPRRLPRKDTLNFAGYPALALDKRARLHEPALDLLAFRRDHKHLVFLDRHLHRIAHDKVTRPQLASLVKLRAVGHIVDAHGDGEHVGHRRRHDGDATGLRLS